MRMDQLTHEGPLKSYLQEVIDRIEVGYQVAGIEEEHEQSKHRSKILRIRHKGNTEINTEIFSKEDRK